MSDELEKDYVKVEVFNHAQNCQKPHEVCEPIKVEIDNIKRRLDDLEETIKEIRGDMRNALIWLIGVLLAILGAGGYLILEQHFANITKVAGG
jgi:tetrahydromethanopterin S-methyltransferase subunit G